MALFPFFWSKLPCVGHLLDCALEDRQNRNMLVVCERKDKLWGDSIRVRKVVVLPLDKATCHVAAGQLPDCSRLRGIGVMFSSNDMYGKHGDRVRSGSF